MADSAPSSLKAPAARGLFRSRLSQRIALAVFSAIVAIEVVILVPSIARREREFLGGLQKTSAAYLNGVFAASDLADMPVEELSAAMVLEKVRLVQDIDEVEGGSLYRADGTLVDGFGDEPQLRFDATMEVDQTLARFYRFRQRYDARWPMSPLDGQYVLIVRHNTETVTNEVLAFVARIAGLVLIISGGVTLAMMVLLRSLLISPILALRRDLLSAAPAALQGSEQIPSFASQTSADRRDELGEVITAFQEMYQHISQAIAQRRRAEQSLRESEARFRAVVNQAAEAIFVIDASGKIRDANDFALSDLGYPSQDLLGQSIMRINPVWDGDRFQEHWQALQAGEPTTIETLHCRRNGQVFPVEVRSSLIFRDGEKQILSLTRDITARKEAEKAQIRLAEIGELAAMIVHEVRNPLATVFMALTGFKRMELPRAGQLRLELALEESERLQRLLNEILSYSREQRLAGELIELNGLTQELCATLRELPQAQERQIELWPETGDILVEGDRDKLKQVFINLVTNACEAIPAGERVTWNLDAQTATPMASTPIASTSSMPQVTITVHNGGDPIPADVLPKLTKPFVSTKATGNGLGLAITKRIVEAHGGSLAIASTAETGTIVTVVFPLAMPEEPGTEPSPDGGSETNAEVGSEA